MGLPAKQTDYPLGTNDRSHLSTKEKQERKDQVLTHNAASHVTSIANAIVIKDEDVFFVTAPDGDLPMDEKHGLGLYYHDCRYLRGYELRIDDIKPQILAASSQDGFRAVFELTTPTSKKKDPIPENGLAIRWERVVESAKLTQQDRLSFHNFTLKPLEFEVTLTFQADFEDIFDIRSLLSKQYGSVKSPRWTKNTLFFQYNGKDGIYRSLAVHFLPEPDNTNNTTAHFKVTLEPSEVKEVNVSLVIAESDQEDQVQPNPDRKIDLELLKEKLHFSVGQWVGRHTQIECDSLLLKEIMRRSLLDLRVLRSRLADHEFFGAGVPWFVTLFGRDSILSALQIQAFEPEFAADTLRLLALYQGQREDEWRDEAPGKIMHSIRVGEMARLGEIPHTPFYGSVDATPLFLILLRTYISWTGNIDLFHELKSSVEQALNWINNYGEPLGNGYVAYRTDTKDKQINQGWKDSGNAIVNSDGTLARSPISLAEVQGYVYLAKNMMAELYAGTGDTARAESLKKEAQALKERFNRDFWLDDQGYYALALQEGHKPAAVLSSNAGQVLWSGIAEPDKARQVVEKLMAEDMFNGWGVRTLSSKAKSYNPVSYHLGSVWPHDNSLIAAGFKNYGFDTAALQIFNGIFEATTNFDNYRLPELFTGFARKEFKEPVRYPVACHPQAWAAGSIPFLLQTILGLQPEATANRLRIVRPHLPDFLQCLVLHGLKVGQAKVDLKFEQQANSEVKTEVLARNGNLEVTIE